MQLNRITVRFYRLHHPYLLKREITSLNKMTVTMFIRAECTGQSHDPLRVMRFSSQHGNVKATIAALQCNILNALQQLNLTDNKLSDAEAIALAVSLEHNTTLQQLQSARQHSHH